MAVDYGTYEEKDIRQARHREGGEDIMQGRYLLSYQHRAIKA